MKILDKLNTFKEAMNATTVIQRTADREHVWWLRFCITPFAAIGVLLAELTEKAGESVKDEADKLKALVDTFKGWELFVSFPVNRIMANLAVPNTSRGMLLMGADRFDAGGVVLIPRLGLSTIGCERFLSLDTAREAAEKLSKEISAELKADVRVDLTAKIAERQISGSEAAQRKDARNKRAQQNQGYQPRRPGRRGQQDPVFEGPSNRGGGDRADLPDNL